VFGQPPTGRCEPDPPTVRFEQRHADFAGQRRELLGHGGGRGAQGVGHRAHGPEPRKLDEQLEPTGLHRLYRSRSQDEPSTVFTWT